MFSFKAGRSDTVTKDESKDESHHYWIHDKPTVENDKNVSYISLPVFEYLFKKTAEEHLLWCSRQDYFNSSENDLEEINLYVGNENNGNKIIFA